MWCCQQWERKLKLFKWMDLSFRHKKLLLNTYEVMNTFNVVFCISASSTSVSRFVMAIRRMPTKGQSWKRSNATLEAKLGKILSIILLTFLWITLSKTHLKMLLHQVGFFKAGAFTTTCDRWLQVRNFSNFLHRAVML